MRAALVGRRQLDVVVGSVFLIKLTMIITTLGVVGCAGQRPTGRLETESLRDDAVVLRATFATAVYAHAKEGDTDFLLTDVPPEDLLRGEVTDGQIMHIQMLWAPKAGATPIDPSATNACIRHVIVSNGEVGLYGGAGFISPSGTPGDERLVLWVYDTNVRLLESTAGFRDLLTPARTTGGLTAQFDPKLTNRLQRAADRFVTDAFGERRFVRGEQDSDADLDLGVARASGEHPRAYDLTSLIRTRR